MTITFRSQVRAAVERALQLDPREDLGAAINAVAQALCLPAETVAEALEPDAAQEAALKECVT